MAQPITFIPDNTPSDVGFVADTEQPSPHDTASGYAAAAAMGALDTAAPGLSSVGTKDPAELLALKNENPLSYGAGQVAGMFLGPVGKAIGVAGQGVKSLVGAGVTGTAAKVAMEAALLQTTNEISKFALHDPNQSLQTAAIDIGLSGVFGGVLGLGGGVLGKGVAKVADSKVGEFINDFRSRIAEHTSLEASERIFNKEYLNPLEMKANENMFKAGELIPKEPLTTEGLTLGQKAADSFMQSKFAGQGAGAGIGEMVGHSTGIPFAGLVGAGIGAKALGPTLDAVIRPLLRGAMGAEGLLATSKLMGAIIRGQDSLSRASKAVFDKGLPVIVTGLPGKDSRDALKNALKGLQDAPESILHVGGPLGDTLPSHNVALGQLAASASQHLSSIAPKPSGGNSPLDTKIPPAKGDEAMYNRTLDIAQQPLMVMQHIKDGTLMTNDLKTFMAIYPNLYPKVSESIIKSMIDHQAKGGTVPYRTRTGLSMFLGQPLDSTMSPRAIQATQAVYLPKNPPQQPGGRKQGTKSLTKFSNNYQTAEQSREARRNK